ncbi:MAG: redoxin domain-containing protein [Phycisphaerales bacterium]
MSNEHLRTRDLVVSPGDDAPDFELPDQNRAPWKLTTALKNGDVVLCFFPMAFTGVCSTEMRCASDEIARWQAKGAQVVGISCDSFAVLKEWAQKEGYKQPLLADMHRAVCRAYGLYWPDLNVAWRGTVVVGRAGKVLWSQRREIKDAMQFDDVLARLG